MAMTTDQQNKLARYFINADPFLWNVLDKKNKKGRILELKARGFLENYTDGGNPNYSRINQDLLVKPGIEGIIMDIVIPRVNSLFKPEILDYFRRCWQQGQVPEFKYLKTNQLYRSHHLTSEEVHDGLHGLTPVAGHKEAAFIFFRIDTQHDFIEGWTTFGGLWFEEIEPLSSQEYK